MPHLGRLFLVTLITLQMEAQTAPATLNALVEEPVVQELMGGCSMKCSIKWEVEIEPVPGGKVTPGAPLNDESAETAWHAEKGSSGVGTKLRVLFPKKIPRELEESPLYGLDFINGAWKTEALWKAHGRVKKIRLHYKNKPFRDVLLADSRRWQRVTFPDLLIRSGDSITVEILEIYRGEKGLGAALSEMVLQGAH